MPGASGGTAPTVTPRSRLGSGTHLASSTVSLRKCQSPLILQRSSPVELRLTARINILTSVITRAQLHATHKIARGPRPLRANERILRCLHRPLPLADPPNIHHRTGNVVLRVPRTPQIGPSPIQTLPLIPIGARHSPTIPTPVVMLSFVMALLRENSGRRRTIQ